LSASAATSPPEHPVGITLGKPAHRALDSLNSRKEQIVVRGFHRLLAIVAATTFAAAGATMLTATPALAINPCLGNNPPPSCDTVGDPTPPAPLAPSNLTITGAFQTEIDLTWTDNATTETGYVLVRTDTTTGASSTQSLPANQTSWAVTGLTPNDYYTLTLSAQRCDAYGDCGTSGSVSASTRLHPQPANPIGGMSSSSVYGTYGYYNLVGWALDFDTTAPLQVSLLEDGVDVADRTANAAYSGLNNSYPGYGDNHGFSFGRVKLTTKGTHTLCVIAHNVGGGTDYQVVCTSYVVPGPPSAATNLVAHNTGTSIVVNFTDNANDETGFWLQRSTDNQASWLSVGSQYSPISGSGATGTATDYSSPPSGTCYRILMVNNYGNTPSGAVCV
jgi:hypothetical protein